MDNAPDSRDGDAYMVGARLAEEAEHACAGKDKQIKK